MGSIEMRRKWDGAKYDVAQECGLHYWSWDLCSELNLYAPLAVHGKGFTGYITFLKTNIMQTKIFLKWDYTVKLHKFSVNFLENERTFF